MARPREDAVVTLWAVCTIHGAVQFRRHKIGFDREGAQRYRYRCPECHARRNRRNKEAQ